MTIKELKKYDFFKDEKIISINLLQNQGFCNINYILKTSNDKYILRVFGDDNNSNRKLEYNIQKKAYKKDIASQTIYIYKDKFMISKFLKGKHKENLNLKNIKSLTKSIKKLHSIRCDIKCYDIKEDLYYYKKTLKDKESKKDIGILKKELKNIKKYKKEYALNHQDLNPKNILFYKNKVKFIDWEYASVNDIYFDLASICVEYKLSSKQEKLFLKSYFKNELANKAKLKSYKIIYKKLCSLWFKNNQTPL